MISTFRFCVRKAAYNSINNYSVVREARMLRKMIKKGLTSKNSVKHGKKVIMKSFLSLPYENENCSQRMDALNKVYMEHIPLMLSSGKYGIELMDFKVEVTKVKISKDFKFLNIYFISKKVDTPYKILEDILSKSLSELQIKLGEFKFLGKVPYLKFVRDIRLENAIQMENIFQVMDLGKDFKSEQLKNVVTPDFSERDSLPKMRQDVFGIDVAKIKNNIQANITRFKAINIGTNENDLYNECDGSYKLMEFTKKDFFLFYKRRRFEELKRRKMEQRENIVLHDDFEYENHNIFENEFEFVDDEDVNKYDE